MIYIIELIIIIIFAISVITIVYRSLPFRTLGNKKPLIALFPKYIAKFDQPLSDIESSLEKMKFRKINNTTYNGVKIYRRWSGKVINLNVEIDKETRQIKVCSSFFGIALDAGGIWQITSNIINGKHF